MDEIQAHLYEKLSDPLRMDRFLFCQNYIWRHSSDIVVRYTTCRNLAQPAVLNLVENSVILYEHVTCQ